MGIYLNVRQGNVSRDQLRQTKYHFASLSDECYSSGSRLSVRRWWGLLLGRCLGISPAWPARTGGP